MTLHSAPTVAQDVILEEALLAAARELLAVRTEAGSRLAALRTENRELCERLGALRGELASANAAHARELEALQHQLKTACADAIRPFQRLVSEFGARLPTVEQERAKLQSAELRIAELQRLVSDARAEKAQSEQRLQAAVQQVEVLEERFADMAAELCREQARRQAADRELTETLEKARAERAQVQAVLGQAQAEVEHREQQALVQAELLRREQSRVAALERELAEARGSVEPVRGSTAGRTQRIVPPQPESDHSTFIPTTLSDSTHVGGRHPSAAAALVRSSRRPEGAARAASPTVYSVSGLPEETVFGPPSDPKRGRDG